MDMKQTYIKPNTELHHISAILMQATSPNTQLNDQGAGKDPNGDYGDAKSFRFSADLWDSDEEE